MSYAWEERPRCWPSLEKLAEYAGVNQATVKRALARLEQCGFIRAERVKPGPGNWTGREIVLGWRDGPDGEGGGSAPVSYPPGERVAHPEATPQRTGALPPSASRSYPGSAPVRYEEESSRKKKEKKNPDALSRPQRDEVIPQPTRVKVPRGTLSRKLAPDDPLAECVAELQRDRQSKAPDPADRPPEAVAAPAAQALDNARTVASLNADPVVSGERSEWAGPMPEEAYREKVRECEAAGNHGMARYYREAIDRYRPKPTALALPTVPDPSRQLPAPMATGNPKILAALQQLGPGKRHVANRAVAALCQAFAKTDVRDSARAYQGLVDEVIRGDLPAEAVVYAYQRSCGRAVANPGAAFTKAIQTYCQAKPGSVSPN